MLHYTDINCITILLSRVDSMYKASKYIPLFRKSTCFFSARIFEITSYCLSNDVLICCRNLCRLLWLQNPFGQTVFTAMTISFQFDEVITVPLLVTGDLRNRISFGIFLMGSSPMNISCNEAYAIVRCYPHLK